MENEGEATDFHSNGELHGDGDTSDYQSTDTGITEHRGVLERPHSTRTSRLWIGSFFGLVVLVAILVFILQNLGSVAVHVPGATIRMPVGIAILFGVILGGLFVFLLGLARVVQLRRSIGRNRRAG
ncbi:lipopolysaccharide assembly protein LapA domain-containing protein [Ferrimicrobium sp.]|uniref:LapA family protein n=1 Tax=Ferrimicrobium sp. TaxID=2926050 RepID=UPI00262F2832|nr:lipopolysaccharide assembly protein LapA domain-containing protein [Ferrimicrobium sp.]